MFIHLSAPAMKIHVSDFTSPQCTCVYVCKVNRYSITMGDMHIYNWLVCLWTMPVHGYSKVIIWLWHSLHGGGYPSSPYRFIYVHGSQGDKEWKTYSSLKPIIHMHASACVLWPHAMWYQCKAIAIAFCIYIHGFISAAWLTPLRIT